MIPTPTRVRGRLLIAALLIIAAAGVVVGIWLTRSSQLNAASMSAYFPERTATVLYLDVNALRASGVLEKLVGSTVGEEAEYRDFVRGTGFDYKNDLHQVMLNSAGGIHYFLLQGRFDWDKLRSWAQSQGGACTDDGCSMKASTPDRVVSFRRLQKNLMAMATARDASGAAAVERRRTTEGVAVPSAPLWFMVPSEAMRNVSSYPAGTRLFAKALESADRALFTLGPQGEQFELKLDVTCHSQEEAAILKAQLEGVTSLLHKLITREQQKPNPGDLSGVLTSGSFNREGAHVLGRWTISKSVIDSLGS
ncbi:MAG TPA: hypothetical protein VES20_07345 [Bryobacteraceae bacterium]|nr:hypothetical protein [Bryobacteraceae bacterium]